MAETKYTIYPTLEGDRWDTIANKAYGDPTKISEIIRANPQVRIYDVFPAGIKLLIPIIDQTAISVDTSNLPPWKR